MKRASYREGVAWIAANDEPMDRDPESIAGYISTLLLADLFRVEPERIAADVLRARKEEETEETAKPKPKTFRHTPDVDNGSSLMGFLPPTTYARLVEIFGPPDFTAEHFFDGKVDAEWVLTFDDGTVATIYNYKSGRAYLGPTAPAVEALTDWHVGGFGPDALRRVTGALGIKGTTIAERYK